MIKFKSMKLKNAIISIVIKLIKISSRSFSNSELKPMKKMTSKVVQFGFKIPKLLLNIKFKTKAKLNNDDTHDS
jgi:hypothetical protein